MTPKYRGRSSDFDGTPLYWRAHPEGYPMRGHPPQPLTDHEINNAELVYTPGYAMFALPEKVDEYLKLFDLIANGRYMMVREERFPKPDDPAIMYCHVWWLDVHAQPGKPDPRFR